MKLSRDSWLALALIITFIIVSVLAAIEQTRSQTAPPLSSTSAAPNGAQALALWLDALQYDTLAPAQTAFALPTSLELIWLLEPTSGITDEEWATLDTWIEMGGTLILAGSGQGAFVAARHFEFDLVYIGRSVDTAVSQSPSTK